MYGRSLPIPLLPNKTCEFTAPFGHAMHTSLNYTPIFKQGGGGGADRERERGRQGVRDRGREGWGERETDRQTEGGRGRERGIQGERESE